MTQEAMFDLDSLITMKGKTCRSCKNRQRWQCGGRVIQYCAVIPSGRTENGLLKIKTTQQACAKYIYEIGYK